jgi:hypothetical protein
MVDYVKDPTYYCQEHGEWYYFHCRKCFAPHGDGPIPLRVKPVLSVVEGPVQASSEQASEDACGSTGSPPQPEKQRRRRRK